MKRMIPLLLACIIVVSFGLAGCGSNTTTETTADATQAATTVQPTEPQAIDPFGKYEAPVTVTYGRVAQTEQKFLEGESYDNNVWTREFESELGIKVVPAWESAPDAYDTKLNLCILSGDLPDLFKVNSPAQLQQLVSGDMVADLTEVNEKWRSPFAKELMAMGKGLAEEQCSINGKLYAYPTSAVVPDQESFVFLRDDLRQELGAAEPQTMEDLLALAKAMVDSKKVKYAFAIGNNPVTEGYMNLIGFFNAYDAFPNTWIKKDDKIVYGGIQPEMKNALTVLRQAFADGLIDKEFVAKDNGTAAQDVVIGNGGICFGQFWMNGWPLPDAYTNHKYDMRGYAVPFSSTAQLKKVQGSAVVLATNRHTYSIKKGYEHPEVVAKMSNYFIEKGYGATADTTKYRINGDVNVFSTSPVQGSGAPYYNVSIHKTVTEAIDKKDANLVAHDAQMKAAFESISKYLSGTFETPNFTDYKYFYGPKSIFAIEDSYVQNGQIMPSEFYGADTPEMIRKMSTLRTSEIQMILSIVSGAKELDEFDKFVADWYKQGGELITAEVNDWKVKMGK